MSISAGDLITFAEHLVADEQQQETGFRAALSRAYYAAYHDCLVWHERLPAPGSLGPGPSNGSGIHAQLCSRLSNPDSSISASDKTKSRQRAYALRNLRDRRTKADYQLNESLTISEAKQAISDAQAIIALA